MSNKTQFKNSNGLHTYSMDEKLQELHRIQPLQAEVFNARNNQVFKKIIKETHSTQLKNLQNVEISLTETQLKLPDPGSWPAYKKLETPQVDIDAILNDYERTLHALKLLK